MRRHNRSVTTETASSRTTTTAETGDPASATGAPGASGARKANPQGRGAGAGTGWASEGRASEAGAVVATGSWMATDMTPSPLVVWVERQHRLALPACGRRGQP